MRTVELLRELADDFGAGGIGEPLQLTQVLLEGLARAGPLERRSDQECALERSRDGDEIA